MPKQTATKAPMHSGHPHAVCRQLLHEFEASAAQAPERRWQWLVAAHIVGQENLGLHLKTHTMMLRFALQNAELREAAGQVLRLVLAPFGHLFGKLPAGNTGRSSAHALSPMPLDAASEQAISMARAKVIAREAQHTRP